MSAFPSSLAALWAPAAIFAQVVLIDLVLAGDNAVAVGIAAANLSPDQRRKVILSGMAAAVIMRICLALVAVQLLHIVGLTLAGGVLLLLVCWHMWRDLRHHAPTAATTQPAKSFGRAFLQILAADLSMSLDNVLAVAGAAHDHPWMLVFGLGLSILLTGLAADAISRLLGRARWIGYVGLAVVVYVAIHMMWEGARGVAVSLGMLKAASL